MISASHNPYFDNGIKVINSRGEKLSEAVIADVEAYIDGRIDEVPLAVGENIGRTVDFAAGRNRYTGYLISLALNSYKGIKVGLDCSNGSAWMLAKSVFDALGATTYVINNVPDGLNINTDCGSTHIEGLRKLVLDEKLDIGFAFDGDADRCLAVDCDGNILTGDHIIYLCAKYMKANDSLAKNTIAATIMSNIGLFKALDEEGIEYVKTDVGDKYVYEAMCKNGLRLGGEESGHIIFSKHASTGDGIITAIKIMEVFIESKLPSSKLCEKFVMYPQHLVNVKVADKDAVLKDEDVTAALEKAKADLGDNGRILIRKSGTEPVIRVMAEAQGEEICRKRVMDVVRAIEQKGYRIEA